MAEPDTAPAPDAAASPQPAAADDFDATFKPQSDEQSFDDVFKVPAVARTVNLIPGVGGSPMDAESWSDYLKDAPAGRIISAFGNAFKSPPMADDVAEFMRAHGLYKDANDESEANARSFGQAIVRPIISTVRAFNEALIQPAVTAFDYGLAKPIEGLEAGIAQAGTEAGRTAVGRAVGAEALARDVAGIVEWETQRGDIAHPPSLPEPVAKARARSVIGEGEEGYFGTAEPTTEDLAARAAAAGDLPPEPRTAAQEAPGPAPVAPETAPPDIHATARQIAPETFQKYDPLVAQRDDLSRWMRELQDQTPANIEAKPPAALADLDAQIADVERKAGNAGARTRDKFESQLDDLHEQRADLMEDLVRNHPDVERVRLAQEKVRGQISDLGPDVAAAYREAESRLPPAAQETGGEPPAESTRVPVEEPSAVADHAEPTPEQVEEIRQKIAGANADLEKASQQISEATTHRGPISTPQMVKEIADDVTTKLVAAGRPEEEARAAAQILAAHYEARAERFGGKLGTAKELYDREGPAIRIGQSRESIGSTRTREFAQTSGTPKTDTPEFKAWFGDSKVVDPNGQPQVVHHGTDKNFRAFNTKKTTQGIHWFTSDRGAVESGDVGAQGRGKILDLYASIKNPAGWDEYDKLSLGELKARGYDGAILRNKDGTFDGFVFDPVQFKSVDNRGTFDPDNPKILEQARRGSVSFRPAEARALVKLFKDADASTVIHESGHIFLEDLLRDAEHEQAPEDVKADAATVRDWLGAKTDAAIRTSQHEKFARGFERYLMEGRAPSKALAGVFAKFKDWLTKIYQSVAKLKSPINDDIRAVFDRMLAHNPERTTITGEEPSAKGMADLHEADAESTHPSQALPVADRIHGERVAEIQARHPELADELGIGKAGTGAETRPGFDGGGDAAGSEPGENGGLSQPGKVGAGGGQAPLGPPKPEKFGPTRQSGLRVKVPRRPPSLADWIKARGGIKDDGGEVSAIDGKSKPGLVKPTGESADDLARAAEEAGFFPENGGERPTANELLRKLDDDIHGHFQWSENDHEAVASYQAALGHNEEVDRLASELNIEAKGLTHAEFWDKVAERLSAEDAARQIDYQVESHETELAEAERQAQAHLGDGFEPPQTRSLEDLERERQQEEIARGLVAGEDHGVEPGPPAGDTGEVQGGDGSRGRGAEPPGRGNEAGRGVPVPRLSDDVANGAADKLGKAGFNPDAPFKTGADGKDLAGNIRLENLRTSDDVDDLLRAWARGRDDLMDARHNEEAYRGQIEVEAARALLCDVAASTLEAEKKLAASGSEADAITLIQWRDRLNMVGDKVATLAAGAGRTLAAFRRMDGAKEIAERLKGKTLFQLQNQARLNATLPTPGKLAFATKAQAMSGWEATRGMIIEYYVNNLISGPITHAAYMVGNLVTALTKAGIETPLAAAAGAVREFIAGHSVDRVTLAEAKAQWISLSKGFRDGFPAAYRALKSGVPEMLEGEITAPQLPYATGAAGAQHAIPGVVGNILNVPSHVVTGIHTLGRTVNYEMEKAALIARQATSEGLEGDAFNRRVAHLDQNTPQEIMTEAAAEATKMVMMDRAKWDSLTSKISNLSNSFLPLKIALPFVQVGANLLHGGLMERTPFGLFEQQIRDNLSGKNGSYARDIQAGKIATGTAIATGIVSLAAEGLITGGEPENANEASLWRMSGKQAYSIRVGDHWVPYRKWLGWYGPLVGMTANVYQIGETADHEGITAAAKAALFGFSEVVGDESWFRGVSDFVEAAKNWQTKGDRYIRNLGTNFIPFSVGLSQVARLVDPYQRQANGFIEQAMSKMPGLSEDLRARRDIFGNELASHMQITPTAVNNDPVIKAMQDVEVWPRQVDKKIRGVPLTSQQYDDYTRIAGREAKARLNLIVNRQGFDQIPGHIRRKMMMDAVSGARSAARSTIMAQSAGGENDIMAKAHATKEAERDDFDQR